MDILHFSVWIILYFRFNLNFCVKNNVIEEKYPYRKMFKNAVYSWSQRPNLAQNSKGCPLQYGNDDSQAKDDIQPTTIKGGAFTSHDSFDTVKPQRLSSDKKTNIMKTPNRHFKKATTNEDFLNLGQQGQKSENTIVSSGNNPESLQTLSPCSEQISDTDYIVSCSFLDLTEVKSEWFPENASHIYLDNNKINSLPDFVFSHLTKLRKLILAENKIKFFRKYNFHGLTKLEVLNVDHNSFKLNYRSFSRGIFDPLINLRKLFLLNHAPEDFSDHQNIPHTFFENTTNLEVLSITTKEDTLRFGDQFLYMRNLRKLTVAGGASVVDDQSFDNVRQLKQLTLVEFNVVSNFSDDALQNMTNLDGFRIHVAQIGIKKALEVLKSLEGKTMTFIIFYRVNEFFYRKSYHSFMSKDGILDVNNTRYLRSICVREFGLVSSRLYVVQSNTFSGATLHNCLKTIDLSGNPLLGPFISLFQIFNLRSIENLYFDCIHETQCDRSYRFSPDQDELDHYLDISGDNQNFVALQNVPPHKQNIKTMNASNLNKRTTYFQYNSDYEPKVIGTDSFSNYLKPGSEICYLKDSSRRNNTYHIVAYLSRSIRTLRAHGALGTSKLDSNIEFRGPTNLEVLDLSLGSLTLFLGTITGLESVRTFNISQNDMNMLSTSFFDTFCSLEDLDISMCSLDVALIATSSARIFERPKYLRRLNLSCNFLTSLSEGSFQNNANLKVLNLSKNRFRNIPFNIENTPILTVLDLRENSITTLDASTRSSLDLLAQNSHGFQLLLSGNTLSCDCNHLAFLHWLRTTPVLLDEDGNFTCLNDMGQEDNTGAYRDLVGFWRKCTAPLFLAVAVFLCFLVKISFLTTFLVSKHRLLIKSFILKMLTGHKIRLQSDYNIDVYMGYADAEYSFTCWELLRFLEQDLKVSTHIRHRDMLPSDSISTSIVEAMNKSWRILLVFGEGFLAQNDEWAVFTYKSAMYAQTAENPTRVVILVDQQVQDRLPLDVLSSVSEENIIPITNWTMNYYVRERLRKSLLPE